MIDVWFVAASGGYGADHLGSPAGPGSENQRCADHVRTVIHDSQADALGRAGGFLEALAIIRYCEHDPGLRRGKRYSDTARAAVFYGVGDGLLGDAVEVGGYGVVFQRYRFAAHELAGKL